jgi:hypothetical protein
MIQAWAVISSIGGNMSCHLQADEAYVVIHAAIMKIHISASLSISGKNLQRDRSNMV